MSAGMMRFWEQCVSMSAGATRFWEQYGALVVLVAGALALALIGWALVRFARTGSKSKVVGGVAAVVVMLWTSEGLLQATIEKFGIPWQFAAVAFFVFEAMMLAAALKAEENRRIRGLPGAAGGYVFVIAAASGTIAAFGAGTVGLIALRIVLPSLAVGLWWILLTSDREDDSEAIRTKRAKQLADREAQWAVTPTTLLIRWGIRKPGQITTTQAQREHLRDKMVALADKAEMLEDGRHRRSLVCRLRVLTRGADRALVSEVAERVALARQIEQLVIPRRGTGSDAHETVSVSAPREQDEVSTLMDSLTSESIWAALDERLPQRPVSVPPVSVPVVSGERKPRALMNGQVQALEMLMSGESVSAVVSATAVSRATVQRIRSALTALVSNPQADVSAFKLNGELVSIMRAKVGQP